MRIRCKRYYLGETMRHVLKIVLIMLMTQGLFAGAEPKLKLLFMEMEQCPWCHRMNEEIFENEKIMQKLRRMYSIEKRMRGAAGLPEAVKPRYYPTTYIFSADGKKVLDELPGYMDPKRFVDYLSELYELEKESLQPTSE